MTRIRAAAIVVFVALACGLAWVVALPLWLGDGLAEPSTWFLLPVMMLTPALAALVVTFTMRIPSRGERARFLGLWPLRPAKRVVWLMVAGWLVPPLLVALGIVLAAALGFVQLDLTFAAFSAEVAKALPAGAPMPPIEIVVISQIVMIPSVPSSTACWRSVKSSDGADGSCPRCVRSAPGPRCSSAERSGVSGTAR